MEAYKLAAENSPDNKCRDPSLAGGLIDAYNDLDWDAWPRRRVVDIEHLVTLENQGNEVLRCHGIWVCTNGMRLEGTMTMRLNVAGKPVTGWRQEAWTPALPEPASLVPPKSTPMQVPTTTSTAFEQGFADRKAWEEWFAATSGEYRNGAFYWSGQRSLVHPDTCASLGGDAAAGCTAAQTRLAPTDVRRKTEPEYRAGWNSLQ